MRSMIPKLLVGMGLTALLALVVVPVTAQTENPPPTGGIALMCWADPGYWKFHAPRDDPRWSNWPAGQYDLWHGRCPTPTPRPTATATPTPLSTVTARTVLTQSTPRPSRRAPVPPTASPTPFLSIAEQTIARHGLTVGSISADGSEITPGDARSFLRDEGLGHVYLLVRRDVDGLVVRYWVHADSVLALLIPPDVVNLPTLEVATIPLDERYPYPHQLARRYDGEDDRIFSYDPDFGFWRHVPDMATFQVLGYYWCNVLAADALLWERASLGVGHPPTTWPAQADYPACT